MVNYSFFHRRISELERERARYVMIIRGQILDGIDKSREQIELARTDRRIGMLKSSAVIRSQDTELRAS
ncbi:hypothetical protein FHS85_004150 [Rhodoligotrophos appendicifer]|uniref:hypothetical protein n=1 Tax=Rhodoligotrophos appendicifer TaxID=987056 RepID=UPI001186A50D|nr:hypothetical protein [Rhodoligotrophos appendicifer]